MTGRSGPPRRARIAIISDTHIPRGPRRLPPTCVAQLRAAELIIHAGDLSTLTVLSELRGYGETVAVHGNVDEWNVVQALPATAVVEFHGQRIAIVHDAGPAPGRLGRLRRRFPGADAVVFGHSHLPLHETDPDGFQIFNPGSPTERRRAPRHTMGVASVESGKLEFRLLALD
jgi:putative phosphoesterase